MYHVLAFGTQDENEKAPLILWLQGGPGASSLYGLFEEMGPLSVTLCEPAADADAATADADANVAAGSRDGRRYTLRPNPYSWNLNYSLLFVDNPVGTGT